MGIAGDRTCSELPTYIHCRNCPVYAAEGRRLLERDVPKEYLQTWTALLAQTTAAVAVTLSDPDGTSVSVLSPVKSIAVVIFRVHREWFALPAHLFQEVTPCSPMHRIPHRSNQILLGLVNIRGELQLCASLAHLLALETAQPEAASNTTARMMVLEREGDRWVFPVDEIDGVQRLSMHEFKPAPTNVAKSTNTYTRGLIGWRNTHVSYLDDELLFYTLARRVLSA